MLRTLEKIIQIFSKWCFSKAQGLKTHQESRQNQVSHPRNQTQEDEPLRPHSAARWCSLILGESQLGARKIKKQRESLGFIGEAQKTNIHSYKILPLESLEVRRPFPYQGQPRQLPDPFPRKPGLSVHLHNSVPSFQKENCSKRDHSSAKAFC